jgi:hypothetical protein
MGTGADAPPPGAKAYSTTDPVAKIRAWYKANLKNPKVDGDTDAGASYSVGDPKTGMTVMILPHGDKTFILLGPSAAMAH